MLQRSLSDYPITITTEENKTFLWFEEGYICFHHKKPQYYYIREALPIKNLVFSGGGTRGILYAGVIDALQTFRASHCQQDQNFLAQIDTLSAASIGSVFTATLAVGITTDELMTFLVKQDFEKLLGTGFGPIRRDGLPLYELLKKIILHVISKRLQEREVELAKFTQDADEQDRQILDNLINELAKPGLDGLITFSMLKVLHHFCPSIFKELTISVVCKETGKPCYFNASNTPNLEIALASRASFAVPIFVKSVEIPKSDIACYAMDDTLPKLLHFVDGGLLDNIPFTILEDKQKDIPGVKGDYNQNLQTLIVCFDDSIAANFYNIESEINEKNPTDFKQLHYIQSPFLNARRFSAHELAPKTPLDFIYNIAPKIIDGININDLSYTAQRENIYEQVRNKYSQRNIPLPAWFTSSDFEKASKYAQWAIEKSKKLTLAYLENHAQECIYQSYSHINQLIRNLPEDLYHVLISYYDKIPCLQQLGLAKIQHIRFHKNERNYYQFVHYYQALLVHQSFATTPLFAEMLRNFSIIQNDVHANNNEKMIRALSVLLDYYHPLLQLNEHQKILFLLADIIAKHIKFKKDKNFINIKIHFEKMYFFYVKLQRIMLVLSYVESTYINPEDVYRRKYLETIINDLCDIASYHLSEKEKLKKMEEYLIESYYKLLFYQKKSNGQLAQAIKHIIESPVLLNLPYSYGIKLPMKVKSLPIFNAFVTRCYKSKKNFFIKNFIQMANLTQQSSIFYTMKNKFFPFLNILSLTLLDEIKMQAIVVALASSVKNIDYEKANYLSSLIIPADLVLYQRLCPTLFDVIKLFAHLIWVNPVQVELDNYHHLLEDLSLVVTQYKKEEKAKILFLTKLNQYYQKFSDLTSLTSYCFFKQSSKILPLIQFFLNKYSLIRDNHCTIKTVNDLSLNRNI